ncbi:MAG: MATE family efflux transporter [Eubacteriales bacterium]|nr:MATE family efflux transporter [Eubacteriales bacterium]
MKIQLSNHFTYKRLLRFVLPSVLGYSLGSAPIISYHYGAENHMELKNLFRKSLTLLTVSGILLVAASEALARPLVAILILPAILEIDGIWMAIVMAELLSLFFTAMFLVNQKKRYHYA